MLEEIVLDIEKSALDLILETRKKQGMSELALGEAAFPGNKNPQSKIHAMWNMKTASNKSLRLRLGDYCAMCRALGLSPSEELAIILRASENK